MSDTKNPDEFIVYGRLSFPNLFKAKSLNGGNPRYQCNILLDPKDPKQKATIKLLRDAIDAKAQKAFKAKVPRHKTCLRNEGTWEGYEGMWYLSLARKEDQGAPKVIQKVKGQGTKVLTAQDANPYAGCYCYFKFRIYDVNYDGVKQVPGSLEIVQFAGHGKPFGAGAASDDDMPETDDLEESEDGLSDGDDDLSGGGDSLDDDDI